MPPKINDMKNLKSVLIISLLSLIIVSCKEKKAIESVKNNISFDNQLFGHIDSLRFLVMNISVKENMISGDFFDTANAFKFKISGEFFNDSTFFIREFDSLGNQTGLFNGKLTSIDEMSGIWMKPDSSSKTPFYLIKSGFDANLMFNQAALRYQNVIKEEKKSTEIAVKADVKPNFNFRINDLIKVTYDFKSNGKQGVKDVVITLENIYRFDFDKVKVKVDYYKSDGVQVKTADLLFVGLVKNKKESIKTDDDKKANYIVARIIEAESSDAKYYFNHYTQMFNK